MTVTLGLTTASGQSKIRDRRQIDSDALKKLRAQLKGGLIRPADPGYEAARRALLLEPRHGETPAVIARCVRPMMSGEPSNSLVDMDWKSLYEAGATVNGLEHLERSRHRPVRMKRVTIDPAKRIGRIDAGVLAGEVMRVAGRYGLAPVFGQCPGVGAAGVTLGGGLGWLSGLHGASCDNLLSARIVTADGPKFCRGCGAQPRLVLGLAGRGRQFWCHDKF